MAFPTIDVTPGTGQTINTLPNAGQATMAESLPVSLASDQTLIPTSAKGASRTLNISASTVIKASAGRVVRVILNVAGSTATTINDCATTGAADASNTILTIPSTAVAGTVYMIDWPCTTGIVVIPGNSAVLAVNWE